MDISLTIDNQTGAADISLHNGDLLMDEGLLTPIVLSLFSDARAEPDDRLADPFKEDHRGWWGESIGTDSVATDKYGSRLWLLRRAKAVKEALPRAENYVRRALDWMIEDGYAQKIDVNARWAGQGVMQCRVDIKTSSGIQENFNLNLF